MARSETMLEMRMEEEDTIVVVGLGVLFGTRAVVEDSAAIDERRIDKRKNKNKNCLGYIDALLPLIQLYT